MSLRCLKVAASSGAGLVACSCSRNVCRCGRYCLTAGVGRDSLGSHAKPAISFKTQLQQPLLELETARPERPGAAAPKTAAAQGVALECSRTCVSPGACSLPISAAARKSMNLFAEQVYPRAGCHCGPAGSVHSWWWGAVRGPRLVSGTLFPGLTLSEVSLVPLVLCRSPPEALQGPAD